MSDLPLIQTRIREVLQALDRHRLEIDALVREQAELEMAAKVIARLTGAERTSIGEEDAIESAAHGRAKPEGIPTMPEMIRRVFIGARMRGVGSMEPKDVTAEIKQGWWPSVDGANVSATMWRLAQRGVLLKAEDSPSYSLPNTDESFEAVDDNPGQEPSTASLFNLAEGREAGPGGGTS